MEAAGVVVGGDGCLCLEEYLPFVDLVVEEEGGDAGDVIAIDDGVVDRGGTTVAWQQRSVEVEGAVGRHVPYRLGQHAEGHDDKHVGLEGGQLAKEVVVAQFLGLQQWQLVVEGVLLDGAEGNLLAAARLTVGHGDNGRHLVAALHDGVEALDSEVGGAEIDYSP